MAEVTKTAAQVRIVYVQEARTKAGRAAAALTRGDFVYLNSSGLFAKADSDALASMPAYGVVTGSDPGTANDPVTVMTEGWLSGFDLSGHNAGVPFYVGATAGAIDSTKPSGTPKVVQACASVDVDANGNKLLRVHCDRGIDFVAL